MANKTIVYCKSTGGQTIPITVRIKWLPNGVIVPAMYWMPDGSCYTIKHLHECVQMAHLKDKGVGIRFKVRAEPAESQSDTNDRQQQEIYIYFTDDFFCGRNFIDGRYGHAGKVYIPVMLDVFPAGDYELIYFWVNDARYMVEQTLDVEVRGCFTAGGIGVRHEVNARLVNVDDDEDPTPFQSVRRVAALYLEINKWYVSVSAA